MEELTRNLGSFANQFSESEMNTALQNNIGEIALDIARDRLIGAAMDAIEMTPEFQYPPLRERLLENLQDSRHYKIGSGTNLIIFDEEVAGTINDLEEGQQAAWEGATGTPAQRLFCWTYGIYKPAREGLDRWSRFDDYPTYQQVIDVRLETWGDKAPYWIFLNDGNAGGAAYPSFSGTAFVDKVRAMAPEILRIAGEYAAADLEEQLGSAIEEQLDKPEIVIQTGFTRTAFGSTASGVVQVERRESRSGIWYMLVIGGRYAGRIQPGSPLPTGEVFR